jgi:hypothetical protein
VYLGLWGRLILVHKALMSNNNGRLVKMYDMPETPKNTEAQLLELAVQAVTQETELPIRIARTQPRVGGRTYDALLDVAGNELIAETKKWAQQANLGALIAQIRNMPGPGVLVADYVNPNMAERLKQQGIQFMDTAGNAYLKGPDFYVQVKGNRRAAGNLIEKERKGRAFSNTGLKVVYAFLRDPDLVGAPYRDIAAAADVAVGTVGWVLNDLKATGYVRHRGRPKQRYLANGRQLLARWVETYPEKLKQKQKVGLFAAAEPGWWRDVNIEAFHAYWGGEIAGAKLTNYLRPEVATVYVQEDRIPEFLRVCRLRKMNQFERDENRVEIYRPFWRDDAEYTGFVDPVLAYADLVATADPRNADAAKMIFENYLDGRLGKD